MEANDGQIKRISNQNSIKINTTMTKMIYPMMVSFHTRFDRKIKTIILFYYKLELSEQDSDDSISYVEHSNHNLSRMQHSLSNDLLPYHSNEYLTILN